MLDGAQRQLCYLVAHLDRSRFRPVVILDTDGPLARELRTFDARVLILSLRDWRRFPEALLRYRDAAIASRAAGTHGIRLVHASDIFKGPYAVHIARRLRIPSVLHIRGPFVPRDLQKHGVWRGSAAITIARRYSEGLGSAGFPSEKITEIHDAVDSQRFVPGHPGAASVRAQWCLDGRVAVGLIGRIEPFKRTIEFLHAVARLPQTARSRALFFLVGEGNGPYLHQVRQAIARLQLEAVVRLTGRRDDMPEVMAALDLVVTLSWGSVAYEAMAAGRSVLTARANGRHSMHTLHDQTAWCLPTDDAGEVAGAMAMLIEDAELRNRLGAAGRSRAVEHLSPVTMSASVQALYSKLLS
jgi:glycosyltransferase involved in cell wall biosynthesis